jgi:phenylpropionate dioxygenase-like ring-hydroxylating dioxygenase large terminal subunit
MPDYLRNCWYMGAWADELPTEGLLARTLLDEPIAFYRDRQGRPAALFDRCPHRFVPLSIGSVANDTIVCRYHGLRFGPDGRCAGNPHGPISPAMRVRAYPVVEKHRALWIWMGDPERADPGMVRDLSFLTEVPETAFSKGYLRGRGDYQLFVDNILDLTHADFLHPSTLGGGTFTHTKAKVDEAGDRLNIAWWSSGLPPTPVAARRLPGVDVVDAWTEVEWTPPSIMVLRNGAAPVGMDRATADEVTNVHILTPETGVTCHYFFASTRNYDMHNAALNEDIRLLREQIFTMEDEPIIRAQQERLGGSDFWDLQPRLLRTDEGPVKVRRLLSRLIAAEHSLDRSAPTFGGCGP